MIGPTRVYDGHGERRHTIDIGAGSGNPGGMSFVVLHATAWDVKGAIP